MYAKPPAVLVLLMHLVPALDGMIRTDKIDPSIRDAVLLIIKEDRSDDFAEWDHLAQIVRQDQALERAISRAGQP